MRMRIDKTGRDNMMMQLIMLISFVKRSYIFGFNNINDAILINNDGMIFKCCIDGSNGTNPFSRNNRADMLDMRCCHQMLFERMFKDDRFIALRAGGYDMNRHFA